jgi:EAL domain-containing protein (putative c-di-GMP-specific phosphodiesterase class I)
MVEEDLRAALNSTDQLCVYYQPQVAAAEGPIIGLEALVRWRHPRRGLISPEQFIPVAEETGLIGPLGDWVMREACRTARRRPGLFVAVNLSPAQFRTPDFASTVIELVRSEGVDPSQIELEVTESVLQQDDEVITQALARLREAGFRIALDDFGTGYSSLSHLRRFEVDKIKIDRSFVQNLGKMNSTAIVTAVVNLGRAMGLQVTAEGVETIDQSRFRRRQGAT